jgi:integrase
MVLIAGCLGLRVSEIVALQWQDFDFPGRTLLIQRSVVHGRVEALMLHRERSFLAPDGWLFANPATGRP